ncbi:MAG: polysaccharide deacetylase family protein [bacterium]
MRVHWTHFAKVLFPSLVCEGPAPFLYLTFDDGPHPKATPPLLAVLRKAMVKATFFLLGERVALYPDIVRQIVEEGHVLGNHGYTHRSLMFRKSVEQEEEIARTDDAIKAILGDSPKLFRPPFGFFDMRTVSLVEKQQKRFVLWSNDPKDYLEQKRATLFERTRRSLTTRAIILLHDNEATLEYLPHTVQRLIHYSQDHDFQFSSLSL